MMIAEIDSLLKECEERNRIFRLQSAISEEERQKEIERIIGAIAIGGVIRLDHQFRLEWWLKIVKGVDRAGPGALLITERLPEAWPSIAGLRVIQTPYYLLQWNEMIRLGQRPKIQYHRSVRDLSHSFVMIAGSADWGRSQIQRQSEILGISDRALTSVPAIEEGRLVQDPDPWCLNTELRKSRPVKWIEGDALPGRERLRFQHDQNAGSMIAHHQRCHFAVAMDGDPDWMDGNGHMTEKMLWAFWSGVPVIWFANPEKRSQLESWGFRDCSDGADALTRPSHADPIPGWLRELALLERITRTAVAQQWQDAQGQRVAENHRRVQALSDLLREHQWAEWRRAIST